MTKFTINKLSWESDFFSKKIGSIIDLDNINKAEFSHFDLLCNKVPSSNYELINTLNMLDFKYVEGEVNLTKAIEQPASNLEHLVIATEIDLNSLLKVSNDMFKFSRFRSPWFKTHQANEFYGVWIKNAILSIYDDICFIVKNESEIKGFITLKKNKKTVSIGLVGVSSKYQGHGVGHILLNIAESYASNFGFSHVSVSTQLSNISAIKLYLKAGYSLGDINYWFYKDNLQLK